MIRDLEVLVQAGMLALPACVTAIPAGADPDDYLIHITRRWSEASSLGDLRNASLSSDDLELRFWAGYGLDGTRGLIVRRVVGEWEAIAAEVASCDLLLPPDFEITDEITPELKEKARSECGEPRQLSQGKLFAFDTVAIRPIKAPEDIAKGLGGLAATGS